MSFLFFFVQNFFKIKFKHSVRGKDVYVIQSIGMKDVNDALFEMQLIAYACKTAAAHSIIGMVFLEILLLSI